MLESILDTIKAMLGIPTSDTAFDQELIVNINSAFMVLHQIGVGPEESPFEIIDNTAKWIDFLSDTVYYSSVKNLIYPKTKVSFDAPGTSFLLGSLSEQIRELEWRLSVQVPIPPEPVVPEE